MSRHEKALKEVIEQLPVEDDLFIDAAANMISRSLVAEARKARQEHLAKSLAGIFHNYNCNA